METEELTPHTELIAALENLVVHTDAEAAGRLRVLAGRALEEYDLALADVERWQRRAEEAERNTGVLVGDAYRRGFQAAERGWSADQCPHGESAPRYRRAWLAGWEAGRK